MLTQAGLLSQCDENQTQQSESSLLLHALGQVSFPLLFLSYLVERGVGLHDVTIPFLVLNSMIVNDLSFLKFYS